jgi:hypothetical protein
MSDLFKKVREVGDRGLRVAFDVHTDNLVQIRTGKVRAYLDTIKNEIDRLAAKEGLVHVNLQTLYTGLLNRFNDANLKTLNDQKNDALEPVKEAAEVAVASAPTTVSTFLKRWDIVDDQRMKAQYIAKLANQTGTGDKKDGAPGAPDLSYLVKPGKAVALALDVLEANKTVDCEKAANVWSVAFEELRPFMDRYREEVLEGPLVKAAKGEAATDKSVALMATMFPKLPAMMTNMKLTALATGADISILNPALGAAVAEYTTSAYTDINEILLGIGRQRDDARKAECKALTDVVAESLKKLPKFDNWPTNRGEKPWPGSDAQYKKGNTFQTKAFWSTGVGFKFDGSIQITITGIDNSNGKDVAAFSRFPNEREVLFPPGTKFKVISNETNQGVSSIKLKEV